jgi:hypothetical protein
MGADVAMEKPPDFEGWKTLVRRIWDFGMKYRRAAA